MTQTCDTRGNYISYQFPIQMCAAHKYEAGVHNVLVDKEKQDIEPMETVILPVTQPLDMVGTREEGHDVTIYMQSS